MDSADLASGQHGADGLDLALKRELRRGERVLWQGRPLARIQVTGLGILIFAIPWTAFSLFWTAMAFVGADSMNEGTWGWLGYAFPLFGVPFVVVGLGMLSTPFLPLFTARKSLFAVTSQRLIQLRLGRTLSSETVPARRIGPIKRKERPDGSGSLQIAVRVGTDSDGDRSTEHFTLGEVADIMDVERHIADMVEYAQREEDRRRGERAGISP